MSVTVLARFVAKTGEEARVEAILRGMVAPTRREPGCRRYDLYRTTANGTTVFCLIERYTGEEAIQAHREAVHYKAYRASIADLLAVPIEVTRLEALDAREETP